MPSIVPGISIGFWLENGGRSYACRGSINWTGAALGVDLFEAAVEFVMIERGEW